MSRAADLWDEVLFLRSYGTSDTDIATRLGVSAYYIKHRLRARLGLIPIPATVQHGTASTYQNWACRCPWCREAQRQAKNKTRSAA